MEKWEQELADRVHLPIPDIIDQRIHLTLKQLKRNHNKSFMLRYGTVAVAASAAFTFGMSSLSPTFAQAIKSLPVIGSIFEMVGDVGMKKGSQLHLATKWGQQVEIGDYVVTFTESLYDGSNINLGLIGPFNDDEFFSIANNLMFTVDGKRVSGYGAGASGKKLDNGTFAGTISITVNDELPDTFVLGILSRDETKTFAKLPVERRGGHQSFPIDKTRTWLGFDMKYEALTLFPTSTELTFQLPNSDPVWNFKVYDDQGRVLQPISGHGVGSPNGNREFKYYFEPVDPIPKQVTIQPYLGGSISTDSTSKISGEWKGNPITLSQGQVGSVTVLDEKWENNKLTLTYEVAGERIFEQVNLIWLEDSKGNHYFKDDTPIRVQGSNNKYQLTFSNISTTDSIYICAPAFKTPQYLNDLAVTIDLQQTAGAVAK